MASCTINDDWSRYDDNRCFRNDLQATQSGSGVLDISSMERMVGHRQKCPSVSWTQGPPAQRSQASLKLLCFAQTGVSELRLLLAIAPWSIVTYGGGSSAF